MGNGSKQWAGAVSPVAAFGALALAVGALGLSAAALVRAELRERDATVLSANLLAHELASAIAACSDPNRSDLPGRPRRVLPPLSKTVPDSVPGPSGYRTTEADRLEPAFQCAGFSSVEPLRAQVQWVRTSPDRTFDETGEVHATVDIDGDGHADKMFWSVVGCTAAQCTVAPYFGEESNR